MGKINFIRLAVFVNLLFMNALLTTAQQLTVQETLDYINKTLESHKWGTTYFKMKLSSDGYIEVIRQFTNSEKIYNKCKMHFSDIRVLKYSSNPLEVRFSCRTEPEHAYSSPSCITCKGYDVSSNQTYYSILNDEIYINDKVFNAVDYLLAAIEESNKYNRNDTDPFAPENYNSSISVSGSSLTKIKLESFGGVYRVWVKIGGTNQYFILDSGASDISLSLDAERELINSGVLKKEHYITPALYRLADGSIIKCRRLILPEMTIGDFKVNNIKASVGVSDSPLLLGRSFLDKFKKWSVDNSTRELLLEN